MAYQPRHQKQLTGSTTSKSDCGPRAVSVGIDWATHGAVRPNTSQLRNRMGKRGAVKTNTVDWEKAIDSYDTLTELDRKYTRLSCTRLADAPWARFEGHIEKGHGGILPVDYGVLRRLVPGRTGSSTFDGGHALFILGEKGGRMRVWDSLNDGRRRGIPKGPVWISSEALRKAATAYGRSNGISGIFGVLVWPAKAVPAPVPVPPQPEPEDDQVTLWDIYTELMDLAAKGYPVHPVIDDIETLLGPWEGSPDEPMEGA